MPPRVCLLAKALGSHSGIAERVSLCRLYVLCTCKPRSSTSGFRYDRYIAVQVKSTIGAATKTREEITKKLMDKLDQAARNLAKKDFDFDAFVFHTADEWTSCRTTVNAF